MVRVVQPTTRHTAPRPPSGVPGTVGWFGLFSQSTRHTAPRFALRFCDRERSGWFGLFSHLPATRPPRPPCGVPGTVGWFGLLSHLPATRPLDSPCGVPGTVGWFGLFSHLPATGPPDRLAECRERSGGSGCSVIYPPQGPQTALRSAGNGRVVRVVELTVHRRVSWWGLWSTTGRRPPRRCRRPDPAPSGRWRCVRGGSPRR